MNVTWIREMKTLAVNKSLFFISFDHGFEELAQAKTAELKEHRTDVMTSLYHAYQNNVLIPPRHQKHLKKVSRLEV